MALSHKLGAGIEHLVLEMPGCELQAYGVPSELEQLHPIVAAHCWRNLGEADHPGDVRIAEVSGRQGQFSRA